MSKTLDEILEEMRLSASTDSIGNGSIEDLPEFKQAILQWVADTVIGKELDSTRLEGTIETAFLAGGAELQKLQLNKLKQHSYKEREE